MFPVPSVRLTALAVMTGLQPAGLSHSEIPGSKVICTYPRSYRSLSTSFIASVSQGIRHAPFLTFFAFYVITYKECSSYFQLLCDSKEFEVFSSIIRILILPIIERIVLHYSLACVNMSKILCCCSVFSEAVPQKHRTAWWRIRA